MRGCRRRRREGRRSGQTSYIPSARARAAHANQIYLWCSRRDASDSEGETCVEIKFGRPAIDATHPDDIPTTPSTRWRGTVTPQTPRCPCNRVCSMASRFTKFSRNNSPDKLTQWVISTQVETSRYPPAPRDNTTSYNRRRRRACVRINEWSREAQRKLICAPCHASRIAGE